MLKKITNFNDEDSLREHREFLESLFEKRPDFWAAKTEVVRKLKDKFGVDVISQEVHLNFVTNYIIELIACLVDSDVLEAEQSTKRGGYHEDIWFHHVDYLGNTDDYSVGAWDAAKVEAVNLVRLGIGFVCDSDIKSQIENLLETEWQRAVELFNKHNAVKEFIAYREGKRVYG